MYPSYKSVKRGTCDIKMLLEEVRGERGARGDGGFVVVAMKGIWRVCVLWLVT